MTKLLKNLYVLGRKIHEDGFGNLHEGTLQASGVAISIRAYHHQFCHPSVVEKIQEATLHLAAIQHPGLVRVIDSVFSEDGQFYLIYDTPFEGTLAEIMNKVRSFPEKQVTSILTELGKTLDFVHQHRLVHGGINPENIDLLANGQMKLRNIYIDDLLNSFVLGQGRSVLNPIYLSPEQLRGEKTTKVSDIFALGALGYVLISGHKPWPEITSIPMLLKNYQKPPEKLTLRDQEIPKYLEDILEKALQAKASLRQQSTLELIGDLRNKKVTISVEELKRRETVAPAKETDIDSPIELPPATQLKRPQNHDNINTGRPIYRRTPPARERIMSENLPIEPEQFTEKPLHNPQVRRNLAYTLIGVFAGVIFLIGHALFTNYFDAVPKVEVPQVVGLPFAEAERLIEERGLRPKIVNFIISDKVSPNCVIESDPEALRIVKRQRIVRLFICKSNEERSVPDLIERELSTVEAILKEKNLSLKIGERVFSNKILRNQIIKQAPIPGSPIKKDGEVTVIVSDGYPVNLRLIDANPQNTVVKITVANEKDWDPQNVFVYTQNGDARQKRFEKLLQPGESKEIEIISNAESTIEVYYFNDLAYKQELKYLVQPKADAQ